MCCGYQTWSEDSLMQVYDDDDLHGGQRSSEVKAELCAMATKLSQKKPWCKFMMMMMTFRKVKGHQRSNVVNFALWLPDLVKRIAKCKFKMMMTFMEVKGQMGLI